jgi:hypothetical protein
MWGKQEGVRPKWVKFKEAVARVPSLILFFITKVLRNNYQLRLLTSIFKSLHFALNS